MFDPIVFDNLKVGFENTLYDLDNLDELILITDRRDRLEMASMSREFVLQFSLRAHPEVTGEVVLSSSLEAIAAEILEKPDGVPGCRLQLRFAMKIVQSDPDCERIRTILQQSWPQQSIILKLQHVYEEEPRVYSVSAEVYFDRNVNEEQMGDIPELAEHMINALTQLVALHTS
ncbi:hypothetical protein [Paenibacillus tundrae]|uniref:Group-specific protein n=1 Tax=Paenibacillus tundrae TaxID=528187 RepID=A0ABT9WD80_9BACL|nr:hypothetical protein [Paenibacillus tundrae]MDQ0171080.1 hypothetical protein [Paenibacillus tundrae]